MKYASLKYNKSSNIINRSNLGDHIQTLAVEQFLPSANKTFERDFLKFVSEQEKHILIMNGWFSFLPESCFPPSDSIVPIFFGFHISKFNNSRKHFLNQSSIDYFKKHEPIGCRDKHTMNLLNSKGVNAFYSKCLTLTFPKRDIEPKNGKVILVDADGIFVPRTLRKNAIRVSHLNNAIFSHETQKQMAKELLDLYRNVARLVITTMLHCALPCIAMGIPVIYFGKANDSRLSILKDFNITIYKKPSLIVGTINHALAKKFKKLEIPLFAKHVDWNPKPVSFEKEKSELISKLNELIKIRINSIS